MTIYASKLTQSFYDDSIHNDIPADAVLLTEHEHAALLDAQSAGCVIDWSGSTPVAIEQSLAQRIELACQAVNAERDKREASTFNYQGKAIDCNPRAVQRITAASLAAQSALMSGHNFSLEWTCADNSVLQLDAEGMAGMLVALAQHADALHRHARKLKAELSAVIDADTLGDIDITAGWPAI